MTPLLPQVLANRQKVSVRNNSIPDGCVLAGQQGAAIMNQVPTPKFFAEFEKKLFVLPWWKKLILKFFVKTTRAVDWGAGDDHSVVLEFKRWKGVTYLWNYFDERKLQEVWVCQKCGEMLFDKPKVSCPKCGHFVD